MTAAFAPGDLVYARGREWVALPSPDEDTLRLRPLSGAEADVQVIHPALEREPIRPARFALPTTEHLAAQEGARLLSEALRLSGASSILPTPSTWPLLSARWPPGPTSCFCDSAIMTT
jgi:hypothetical protein